MLCITDVTTSSSKFNIGHVRSTTSAEQFVAHQQKEKISNKCFLFEIMSKLHY